MHTCSEFRQRLPGVLTRLCVSGKTKQFWNNVASEHRMDKVQVLRLHRLHNTKVLWNAASARQTFQFGLKRFPGEDDEKEQHSKTRSLTIFGSKDVSVACRSALHSFTIDQSVRCRLHTNQDKIQKVVVANAEPPTSFETQYPNATHICLENSDIEKVHLPASCTSLTLDSGGYGTTFVSASEHVFLQHLSLDGIKHLELGENVHLDLRSLHCPESIYWTIADSCKHLTSLSITLKENTQFHIPVLPSLEHFHVKTLQKSLELEGHDNVLKSLHISCAKKPATVSISNIHVPLLTLQGELPEERDELDTTEEYFDTIKDAIQSLQHEMSLTLQNVTLVTHCSCIGLDRVVVFGDVPVVSETCARNTLQDDRGWLEQFVDDCTQYSKLILLKTAKPEICDLKEEVPKYKRQYEAIKSKLLSLAWECDTLVQRHNELKESMDGLCEYFFDHIHGLWLKMVNRTKLKTLYSQCSSISDFLRSEISKYQIKKYEEMVEHWKIGTKKQEAMCAYLKQLLDELREVEIDALFPDKMQNCYRRIFLQVQNIKQQSKRLKTLGSDVLTQKQKVLYDGMPSPATYRKWVAELQIYLCHYSAAIAGLDRLASQLENKQIDVSALDYISSDDEE